MQITNPSMTRVQRGCLGDSGRILIPSSVKKPESHFVPSELHKPALKWLYITEVHTYSQKQIQQTIE